MKFKISLLFLTLLFQCSPDPGACKRLINRIDKIYSSGDSNMSLLIEADEKRCFGK